MKNYLHRIYEERLKEVIKRIKYNLKLHKWPLLDPKAQRLELKKAYLERIIEKRPK
tara:strand:+ start:1333 stop:1500 length:168 start_codon:yes stop_codon:yes gene_type:complete